MSSRLTYCCQIDFRAMPKQVIVMYRMVSHAAQRFQLSSWPSQEVGYLMPDKVHVPFKITKEEKTYQS